MVGNVVKMKCEVCGARISVSRSDEKPITPIYCCGIQVSESHRTPLRKKAAPPAGRRKTGASSAPSRAAVKNKSPRSGIRANTTSPGRKK